jgi:hypothetical protein
MFLLAMWLGLPAVALALVGIHASVSAADKGPKWLLIVLTVLVAETIVSPPVAVTAITAGLYVALALLLGLSWWRRSRRTSDNAHDV